jgi:hypothetical protein
VIDPHEIFSKEREIKKIEIEYIFFEPLDLDDNKNLKLHDFDSEESKNWIAPSLCFDFNVINPKLDIPTRFKATLDKIDILNKRKLGAFRITYEHLNYNYSDYDRFSYEKIENNGNSITRAFRLEHYLNVNNDNEKCFVHNGSHFDKDFHSLNLVFDFLFKLNNGSSSFDYYGTEYIRGIKCDVYGNQYKDYKSGLAIYTLVVESVNESNGNKSIHNQQKPVEAKLDFFSINEGKDKSYTLKEAYVFNFYDFETIQDGDKFVGAFNTMKCDTQSVREFNLIAKNGKKFKIFIVILIK